MGQGRKPLPTNLKLITGTERPDRKNEQEPQVPVTIPDPPDYLDDRAQDKFVEMAGKLARMRVMSDVDIDALAFYCVRWCDWREAVDKVAATGHIIKSPNGYPIKNPWASTMEKAHQDCMKILAEFGMTPSSRTRVKAT